MMIVKVAAVEIVMNSVQSEEDAVCNSLAECRPKTPWKEQKAVDTGEQIEEVMVVVGK